MAEVTLISVKVTDYKGKSKRVPFFMLGTVTDTDVNALLAYLLPKMDAAIGGIITGVQVTKDYTLPGGLSVSPDDGKPIQEGALLGWSATGTTYRHGIFVPTWNDAGFEVEAVVNAGVYATFISAVPLGDNNAHPQVNDQGAALQTYLGGSFRVRK